MSKAVVFGAGNIGRGFIGQLFSETGYEVGFVDIDAVLLAHFNLHRGYHLQTVYNEEVQDLDIRPVFGIHADDQPAVADLIAEAEVGATAVGVRALPYLVPNLVAGLSRRAATNARPFNLILCENLKGAAQQMREAVAAALPAEHQAYLAEQVGFVDTVIGRMVPPPLPEMRDRDPGFIRVEPYKELPVDRDGFRGGIPEVTAMMAHDSFALYTARKLYIHNCGHALLAYFGHVLGYQYGYQAMEDDRVQELLRGGWQESARGIVHAFDADPEWLHAHMDDLDHRFRNRALGDTVFRLGRDPLRKLGPKDRLVAPARLAEAAGVFPENLATGIAMALCFDAPDDPVAVEMQARIGEQGLLQVLAEVCEIRPEEKLGEFIARKYQQLCSGL